MTTNEEAYDRPWQLRFTKYRDWDEVRSALDAIWPEWEDEGDYEGIIDAAVDMELIPSPHDTRRRIDGAITVDELELDFSEEAQWERAVKWLNEYESFD